MSEQIRIAICDDCEQDMQKTQQLLSRYLDENNLYVPVDTFSSGEALLAADISSYGLIFLDIFMGRQNGMETAKQLIKKNRKAQIVFASTSIDFAAEAFDIEALHYMVKPIEEKQMYRVLDKYFESFTAMRTIAVKVGRQEEDIYISEIMYIEAKGKKTILHLKNGSLEASQSLSEMMALLPDGEFCMPIRWACVSMREITALYTGSLQLSDGTEIPVSRGKREEVKAAFAEFKWADMRRRMRKR